MNIYIFKKTTIFKYLKKETENSFNENFDITGKEIANTHIE